MSLTIHRRRFLAGLAAALAAPAVVKAASLMPVRGIIMPAAPLFAFNGDPDTGFAGVPLTFYVDGNVFDSSTNNGLTPQTAFRTLDEALRAANSITGDTPNASVTLQLADGDYTAGVAIQATNAQFVTVQGQGRATRIASSARPALIATNLSTIQLSDLDWFDTARPYAVTDWATITIP